MSRTTTTLNPLHFEDLEPHRFEDLVRQLIYDLRPWKSLEALGRTGTDEGIDIRGIESSNESQDDLDEEGAEDRVDEQTSERDNRVEEREWVIQCKREKSIGPQRLRSIIAGFFSSASQVPYGYVLVAACDFSKAARDAFRAQMISYGVQEFTIWGKSEVEDQLFLPKYDYLLFAYFGISLQLRRRSARSQLRSRLALKRKLVKELGPINRQSGLQSILIRDPHADSYPHIDDKDEFAKNPGWRYWQFRSHQPPDHMAFIGFKRFAYVNWQSKEWDALDDFDAGTPAQPRLFGLDWGWWDSDQKGEIYRVYWERHVPEENRAWAIELRVIHYDRILAFDEIGDAYNEGPHLLVDYVAEGDPFEPEAYRFLETTQAYGSRNLRLDEGIRISFFPKNIPDERDAYKEDLRKRGNV